MIDLSTVVVVGGTPNALTLKPTARLEHFGLEPGRMSIRTSGTDGWPVVDGPQGRDGQAGTLWILGNLGGKWYATGAERLRQYQLNGDKPVADPTQGGLETLVGRGWLYDAGRWGVMAGWQPAPGEVVGIFISAGSTRSDWKVDPEHAERTAVWFIQWPYGRGNGDIKPVAVEGASADTNGQGGGSGGGGVDPRPTDNQEILERLDRLEAATRALADTVAILANNIGEQARRLPPEYIGETVLPLPWGNRPVTVVLKPRL